MEATKYSITADSDRDEGERRENEDQLIPEGDAVRFVGDLDRVAEVVLPEVEPDADRDLKLVDQDEEDDAGARVAALPHRDRRQQGGRMRIGVVASKNGSAIVIIRRTSGRR